MDNGKKAMSVISLLEQKEFQELLKWVRTIPDCYEDLEVGACIDAKKYGKTQEMINFIKENSPNSSEFILFCCNLDPDRPVLYKE